MRLWETLLLLSGEKVKCMTGLQKMDIFVSYQLVWRTLTFVTKLLDACCSGYFYGTKFSVGFSPFLVPHFSRCRLSLDN